jgi:ppGpp synthetase/RelA/SpoT-type nucleotidyltranferase
VVLRRRPGPVTSIAMIERDDEKLVQRLLREYEDTKAARDELAGQAEAAVKGALEAIVNATVAARVKEMVSFERKLRKDGRRPIEDGVGIRVLLRYRSDIPWAVQALRCALRVQGGSFVDKSSALGAASFGYRSVQFIAKLPYAPVPGEPPWMEWAEAPAFPGERADVFEVQIRTIAEHAWSEVDHELQYHGDGDRDSKSIKRQLATAASLVETADTLFDSARDEFRGNPSSGFHVAAEAPEDGFVQRFVETNPACRELDESIGLALNIPMGLPERGERDVESAAMYAGWDSEDKLRNAVSNNSVLALRMAIASADVTRTLLCLDSPAYRNHSVEAFRGIGVYWLAIALGPDPDSVFSLGGVVDGRLAEYQTVAKCLIERQVLPALVVRDAYRRVAAPPEAERFEAITLNV